MLRWQRKRDARKAVTTAATYFGTTLDWSEDSIRDIDQILDQIHRSVSASEFPPNAVQRFAEIFGSYFGEILRQAQGATWGTERIYSSRLPALRVGPSRIVINPLRWADERITDGAERDLWTYYQILVRSIQAGESEDADSVQSTPQGQAGVSSDKLYTLRHDQGYFDTGTSKDGHQILAQWSSAEPMAIFFDGAGNLLRCEVRPLSIEAKFGTPEYKTLIEQAATKRKADRLSARADPNPQVCAARTGDRDRGSARPLREVSESAGVRGTG